MGDAAAKSVWITRAEPAAEATARRVLALGLQPIVAPLLRFQPLDADLELGPGEALAFTSVSGVVRTAALTSMRDMAVFAVGEATAEAATMAGFKSVSSADGDVARLAALITAARPSGGVLHPAARQTAGDLVGALMAAGVQARKAAVYETIPADALPEAASRALAGGRLAAILLHSPKAARCVANLLRRQVERLANIAAVGLSPACLEPLRAFGFARLIAADHPTEAALMARLSALEASA